ncbi:hypothetical protein F5Y00DRAFT_258758 [Daldinia vernicosa]|uniref:uncharacterized protein n=1 Tax=Daldinia vernicosa TaxID=114800 RepID=UPI0020084C3C|nr:uncharacterized protein F5Y00DRAFT_258758 [Daldinia vernicosa]KAI0852351.1 hypothetical protein F5Y00DRAFT_258758 [Daldinia vernicosa]
MQSYHHDAATAPIPIKGKEPVPASCSTSSHPFPYQRRRPFSQSTIIKPYPVLTTSRSLGALNTRYGCKTNTWTSSSGELGLLSESEEADGREEFVDEYNRLAKRVYGIRLLVTRDFPVDASVPTRRPSWLSKALRRTSSGQSTQTVIIRSEPRQLRHRRSVSDVALNLVHHVKRDELKGENLQDLVRLCGKSIFYLPTEYAPCSLVLPTCFRALAQALVQHADTRGIFRVPGSARVVSILYDYYCPDRDARGANAISITTRCPNLPTHIKCSAHDIASAFKKFIAGLPGGILGSLSLFDAFVAIYSQLHADPELTKTRESKLRARLIALAIGTVRSQYQRELICAVFGLLCFVGRAAENAPREDEDGRPLPTSDLMGYNALSIVFGPLLINDLIDSYSMKLADPAAGLVLLPVSAPKSRKERYKHRKSKSRAEDSASLYTVDKIHVANNITEMLIIHWREVVRQMRSLGTLKISRHEHIAQRKTNKAKLGSSASDSFPLRRPPKWSSPAPLHNQKGRSVSPLTRSPTPFPKTSSFKLRDNTGAEPEPISIKRRRSRPSSSCPSRKTSSRISENCLSPTAEESPPASQYAGSDEASVGQTSHPAISSAARTSPSDSIESALENQSLDRASGGGESETGGRTRERPFRTLDVHEDPSVPHNRSSSSHILSGSELTFHSVKSSIVEISNNEGYSSRQGYATPRAKEFGMLKKSPSKKTITPARSSRTTEEYHSSHAGDYLYTPARNVDYSEKWKALSLASKTSTESLAKAAKERRLRRSPGNSSFRRSEELSIQRNEIPSTPKWKQQLMDTRSEGRRKPAKLSPEKKSVFEKSPQSGPLKESALRKPGLSPGGSVFEGGSRPILYRSSSKPTQGAVKAIAALFDNTINNSPISTATIRPKRIGCDSSSILSPYSISNSPSKAARSNNTPTTNTPSITFDGSKGRFQPPETPTRSRESGLSIDDGTCGSGFSGVNIVNTPTKFPRISLRPVDNTLAASKKVPLSSTPRPVPARDRELDQPPSLGTMVPPLEEPPIAQHINFTRPYPSSPPSCDENYGRASTESPRPGSGNSMLHAQIRHLQKHLEHRAEENTQLRRQLEARENMDIGKLCEQLRAARREAKMWRERAEAAEKRVAVFKQFTARVRGLRESVTLEDIEGDISGKGQVDGPSQRGDEQKEWCNPCYLEVSEDREGIEERIRQYTKKQASPSINDKSCIKKGELWSSRARNQGPRMNAHANRTAQLWDITDELLMLDGNTKREGY